MPGHKPDKPQPSLIYADTIPGEAMPTNRIQFVQYNMHYRNPKFYDLIKELNVLAIEKEKPMMYLMPLLWEEDSAHVSREVSFFNDDTNFPYWKFGNTYADVDPQWEDQKIYEHSDWLVEWTRPASMVHAMGLPADDVPPTIEWAQWHWMPEDDISINETWPVFNGRYTNPEILTASIEGLPLGDLNWFPEAKALWEKNKQAIDDHMRETNVERLDITVNVSELAKPGSEITVYPNPVKDVIRISRQADMVDVYDLTGSLVRSAQNVDHVNVSDFSKGIYLVRVKVGTDCSTHKVVITK
jgi:hypothetical protein